MTGMNPPLTLTDIYRALNVERSKLPLTVILESKEWVEARIEKAQQDYPSIANISYSGYLTFAAEEATRFLEEIYPPPLSVEDFWKTILTFDPLRPGGGRHLNRSLL